MRAGYICLETHLERPGLVRVLIHDTAPNPEHARNGDRLRYVARFKDVDAAQMHAQNGLHSQLIDLNNRIYRVGLVEAMAVIEADTLSHRRVWIDPSLDRDDTSRMDRLVSEHRSRHQRNDRIWQTVGSIAVALLVVMLLGAF